MYMCNIHLHIYIYIYTYIHKERERERDRYTHVDTKIHNIHKHNYITNILTR